MFTIWLVCFIAAELGYFVYCLMKAPEGVTLICGMCFIAIFFGFVFAPGFGLGVREKEVISC